MADVVANSFENLTHSGLFNIKSKDDKNVSLSLDVWNGMTSLVVFTGQGGKPWKVGLGAKTLATLNVLLKKMRAAPATCREPMFINEFEQVDGKYKMKQRGCVGFGIDENSTLYIDVQANDLNGRYMFPIKPDAKADFSNTSLSEKDMLVSMLSYLIHCFELTVPLAERLSGFKRTGGNKGGGFGGGGGNKGGFSGGGGGGGNNFGNRSQQQSNTFSGGPDIENDLHL